MFGALFLTTAVASSAEQPAHPPQQVVRYENAGRTSYFEFSEGFRTHGNIRPQNPNPAQKREFDESLGYPLYDCSDSSYQCLRSWFSVFAIPRRHLSSGMRYAVDGAQLKVEQCLRGSNEHCQVALISSDCQVIVGTDACKHGERNSSESGPITYFIFNEDYGVTAFGTGGEWPKSPTERLSVASAVATQNILQGRIGLLRANVATAPLPKLEQK